jgi:hypothetical protein
MKAKKTVKPTKTPATGSMKLGLYPKWSSIYHLIVGLSVIPSTKCIKIVYDQKLQVQYSQPQCVCTQNIWQKTTQPLYYTTIK